MENEYENLRKFWDSAFGGAQGGAIPGPQINEPSFLALLHDFIGGVDAILDYGTGMGWAAFDAAFAFPSSKIVGMDPSKNAIDFDQQCLEASSLPNLSFVCGDESALDSLGVYFDRVFSFNVIDVLPDEVIDSVLAQIKKHTKPGAKILIGINPDFPKEFFAKMGYEFRDGGIYKDGVYRGNDKTTDEWIAYLSREFSFLEMRLVSVVERERQYPRRVFVLERTL